jgi:hypothetical protein
MKTVKTHGTFEEAIAAASQPVQDVARALKKLVTAVDPDVVEVPWPKQGIIGYGVGPRKMSEQYCYIAVQREYANLGFYYGADLPDPKEVLEGSGKKLRHIKIRSVEEVDRPEVRQMVLQALGERQTALGLG